MLFSFTFTRATARFCCMRYILFLLFFTASIAGAMAQMPGRGNLLQNMPRGGGFMSGGGGGTKDTLLHRTGLEDSVTVTYRYLDTARFYYLDSSVNDFSRRWIPWHHVHLGNHGNASRSLLFTPNMQAGWDPGMHALDAYSWTVADAKFYNTTRPYSELHYVLGSKAEQQIQVFHTQNIRSNWNFSFQYRLINSPGFFKNQKTNHNNYQFNTWYVSPNRRYGLYFLALANQLGTSENGGITYDSLLKRTDIFADRFNIPTKLGGDVFGAQSFLSTNITTGNLYRNSTFLLRQHYDLGKKDSVVNDSNVVHYFLPRLRFEHTLRYRSLNYTFTDQQAAANRYLLWYDSAAQKPFRISDAWSVVENEFALYQFPDKKNTQQFFRVGAGLQLLSGKLFSGTESFSNIYTLGEYRNKSRNQVWDIALAGTLYMNGLNSGDYSVLGSMKRMLGNKSGFLTLAFQNVNRTPSFLHDDRSHFKQFNAGNTNFGKENSTMLRMLYEWPRQKISIGGRYFLMSNYTFFTDYFRARQQNALFNLLQIELQKTFHLSRNWRWHSEIYLQQATGNAPVNVPLLFTRNRLSFEGVFFKNLNLATGLEMRYHTAYKADGYSPVLGQFFLQQEQTIRNLPDIAAYLHFRVRSFYLFARAENLNSFQLAGDPGFFNNNFSAPSYPMPGLQIRFGIFWGFVN